MNPIAIWITGLPGSGKSTLAQAVLNEDSRIRLLRMDDLRRIVTPNPSYSDSERELVYRALVYTAVALTSAGHDVLLDATANRRAWRELARGLIPAFGEVYLRCPPDVLRAREAARIETFSAPRDIYLKADAGAPVPGVGAPYEEPLNAELVIDSASETVQEEVRSVMRLIDSLRFGNKAFV